MNGQLGGPGGSLLRFRYCWTTFKEAERPPAANESKKMKREYGTWILLSRATLARATFPTGPRSGSDGCCSAAACWIAR
jgi:hypothetical protein